MHNLLVGKTILITGVITNSSIAFAAAKFAQEQGAEVILTGYGRLSLVERIARRLPVPPPVIELDVTDADQLANLAGNITGQLHVERLDGVVHSIAFAPRDCFDGGFMTAPWESVATGLHTSAYSLQSLTRACLPLLGDGSSIVGLTFDATVAWPAYDWMGVAKAALESTNRYLARELGPRRIRANLVAAGPLATVAARSIQGLGRLKDEWSRRAPLGWDATDPEPAGRAVVALLSDLFPATTGEIVHVDGGFHAVGD